MMNRTRIAGMIVIAALCAAVLSACAAATAAPTTAPTPKPTEAATAAPTEAATATEAPTEAATPAPTEAPTEAAGPAEVVVNMATDPKLGPILVDDKGMTLYLYTKDTADQTTCYEKCAKAWPPLLIAEDGKVTAGPGVTGKFSTIARTDGTYMVAYNGVALYYYDKDTKPGDVIGENVGKVWHVVKP